MLRRPFADFWARMTVVPLRRWCRARAMVISPISRSTSFQRRASTSDRRAPVNRSV